MPERPYIINLNTISNRAFQRILKLDNFYIESKDPEDYLGIAYFWNHAYRHWLRDATPHQRVRVYCEFRKRNLVVDVESDEHEQIVRSICEKQVQS